MTKYHTQRVTFDSFRAMIPLLIGELSIGRAQIVIEQIRHVAEAGQLDRLVILTTSETGRSDQPIAAAFALLQAGPGDRAIGDSATVVHAGKLRDLDGVSDDLIVADLSTALIEELRLLDIHFVLWATDEVKMENSAPLPSTSWCQRFGFQQIGTLEYRCGPVPSDPNEPFCSPSDGEKNRSLQFHPLCRENSDHWEDSPAFDQLVQLVDRTYANTLDCPGLSEFRSTSQVLEGYRASEAFDPSLWFTVTDPNLSDTSRQDTSRQDISGQRFGERTVGCAILATHQSKGALAKDDEIGSVEIVYMGLVPEARGSGLGKRLVQQSFDVAREIGANQVLLAVDQINLPAKSIYQLAGLKPMINETIWVRSIDSNNESVK